MTAPAEMHPELQAKLAQYRERRAFNAEAWVHDKTQKLNDYMRRCGLKACVTSVSGGVDSAVTIGLVATAAKAADSPIARVIGLCQPIQSSAWALNRGTEVNTAFGAEQIVVDQTAIHQQLKTLVDTAAGIEGGGFAGGQLKSYMRTPVGYYVAQLISQGGHPCVVMGTGNQDEDGYLAYFCKAGDGVVDIQLISDLHKSEVFKVGRVIGVPESVLVAPPSADLWEGHTDEGELGFPYDFVELFTGDFLKLNEQEQAEWIQPLSADAKAQFATWREAAEKVHRRNKHKLAGIVNL